MTQDFVIDSHWRINGKHYQRTLEDWLVRFDARKHEIYPLLEQTYGQDQALKW